MAHPLRLADLLARANDDAADWQPLYDTFVDGLRKVGIGDAAPRVGETFPAFALPDSTGAYRSLDSLLGDDLLVLSFNRGGWCPYCRHELEVWAQAMPELHAAGGRFVAITGEVGGRAAALATLFHGTADLLCDVDHGVALASGLAFHLGEMLQRKYKDFGLDLAELYGASSGFLPVPATFVIDGGGVVRYAFVDPDFRTRAEPDDVIAAVIASRG